MAVTMDATGSEYAVADRSTPARRMADAIRALAVDAVDAVSTGHVRLPLGMADAATVLWTRFHKFDAADPRWPDRDRFVLSAGHGSMLLYALLHLTGHDGMGIDALKRFCRPDSPAAGHSAFGRHAAIEATSGPLGQGIATAVGLALAERILAARFGRSLVDHRTWVIASDGDLMEGISHEAGALAGHLRLEKLAVLWNDNARCLDGETAVATSEDPLKRFAAYGWAVRRVDGHDPEQIAAALAMAMRSKKPTLIAARTDVDRAVAVPPDADDDRAPFDVPAGIVAAWRHAGVRGATARRAWLKRLARHPQRAEFERVVAGRLPETLHEALWAARADHAEAGAEAPRSTIAASHHVLAALARVMPELVGGAADLTATARPRPEGMTAITPGAYGGRYVHYGIREHAMAAAMNGLALHGGLVPYGGTCLVSSDYMRPALRLAAIMGQRVIHVLADDSIGAGEAGLTHQPVEHLASLRAMPNLHVFRPADAVETAECWELALRRADGPSVLALGRHSLPALRVDITENRSARGGYVLAKAPGPPLATLIASGSEVALALDVRALLAAEDIPVAVVSLPCWELFALQDDTYRDAVLGHGLRVGIEAAGGFGWERWLGMGGMFIGLSGYGVSAQGAELYRHFGITADAVATSLRRRLAGAGSTKKD